MSSSVCFDRLYLLIFHFLIYFLPFLSVRLSLAICRALPCVACCMLPVFHAACGGLGVCMCVGVCVCVCLWVGGVLLFLQNEVESIRLRTTIYEMIIAQHGNFTIVVTQSKHEEANKEAVAVAGAVAGEEKKEGEGEKKGAP